MPKINMETLLPFIEEAFSRDLDFQIPITGTSMNPLLYQNRDFAKIQKPVLPLQIGDIPLYRRNDGAFVLHRVVGIKNNGEYIMCGDNQFLLEYGITDANIIGIAKTLIINGKEIDVDTDAQYLKHKKKYVENVGRRYPIRKLRYKLHFIKEKFLKTEEITGTASTDNNQKEEMKKAVVSMGNILIGAIKSQITETDFEFPENTDFKKLYELAQSHRVTAMVAPVVIKSKIADSQVKSIFSKELFKNAARYTAQKKEYEQLSAEFSVNKIKHCFLKGTKVAEFYNNPDCRFMLDMDLFVEPEKFEEAEEILCSRGYEINSNGDDKDTAYIKKPFLIIELHRELKYDYDKGYDYYKSAFERMVSANGYEMSMTKEDFYVYVLSHTAHHFETAGTGVKSIVDHYYLKNKLRPQCDEFVLNEAIEKIGLTKFSEQIDRLCDYWFANENCDDLIGQMSSYILLSGVFGNETNNYLSGVAKGRYEENTNSYFLKRLFPPLKTMSYRYKLLQKVPVFLPFFWVVRIFSSFFDRERIAEEAKDVMTVDSEQKEMQKNFLENMGL